MMIIPARSVRLRFFIVFGLVAIVLWVAIAIALHNAYRQEIDRARIDGRNLARGLATQVESSIRAIDRSLLFLRDEWENGPGAFAAAVTRHRQFLIDESVSQVAVIDADGWVAYSNLPDWQRVDLGDREHFRIHKDRGADELYISEPVLGRVSKQWTVQFTRPIYNSHQQFAGVLVFSVPPPALKSIYDDINLGARGMVYLGRLDGRILAHTQDLAKAVAFSLTDVPEFGPDSPPSGDLRRRSKIDGVDRLFSYQKLRSYPLIVGVGQTADTILASYFVQRTTYLITGVLFTVLFLVATLLLISRRLDEETVARDRARLATIVENSNDAVVGRDLDRKIVIWNAAAERLLGWTAAEAIGQDLAQMFPPEEQAAIAANRRRVTQGGTVTHEAVRIAKDGRRIAVSLGVSPIKDDRGNIIGSAAVFRDITALKQAEERIQHLAHYDSLTDIPNRRLFYDRLSHATRLARRDRRELALLYIDLDRFKAVNDTLGHTAGDELLKCVADRIRRALRESDTLARMGGDEFAVILPAISSREDVAKVTEKIIGALSTSFELSGQAREVTIGASIGIAIYPADAQDIDTLIKAADTAMYNAKQVGNSFRFCALPRSP